MSSTSQKKVKEGYANELQRVIQVSGRTVLVVHKPSTKKNAQALHA